MPRETLVRSEFVDLLGPVRWLWRSGTKGRRAEASGTGRWEGLDVRGRRCALEFTATGAVRAVKPYRGIGTYRVSSDGALSVRFSRPGGPKEAECRVRVSASELVVPEDVAEQGGLLAPAVYRRVEAFSAGIDHDAAQVIVGTWKTADGKQTYTFAEGGVYSYSWDPSLEGFRPFPNPTKGKYALTETSLRLESSGQLAPPPSNITVVVEEDALTIGNQKFERAGQ